MRLRLVTSSIGGVLVSESTPKTIDIEVLYTQLSLPRLLAIVRRLHKFSFRGSDYKHATTRFCQSNGGGIGNR
jgi:hypothetical protein